MLTFPYLFAESTYSIRELAVITHKAVGCVCLWFVDIFFSLTSKYCCKIISLETLHSRQCCRALLCGGKHLLHLRDSQLNSHLLIRGASSILFFISLCLLILSFTDLIFHQEKAACLCNVFFAVCIFWVLEHITCRKSWRVSISLCSLLCLILLWLRLLHISLLSLAVHSWPWKQQLTQLSPLKVPWLFILARLQCSFCLF